MAEKKDNVFMFLNLLLFNSFFSFYKGVCFSDL